MTLIFYDGTDLHCDRRMLSHTIPNYVKDHAIKWQKSSDNQFAWGLSGSLPTDDSQVERIEESLRGIVEIYASSDKFDYKKINNLSERFGKTLQGRFIVLTQRKAMVISCDGSDDPNSFVVNITGTIFAVGSEPQRAVGVHRITRDVVKTFINDLSIIEPVVSFIP